MKKIQYYKYALALILTPFLASAQTLDNPIKTDTISGLLALVLDVIVKIGLPIIVLFFIFAGFKFVIARGNPTELQKAKTTFMYTVVGAAVILGAKVLSEVIKATVSVF